MTGPTEDFGFGFNDANFSDRVLRIEVISDSVGDWDPNKEDLDNENVVEVKTLHICSLLLAAKSPFFRKLFKNGMRESHEQHVTLRINTSEDIPLMDMLKFMYSNTFGSTSPDLFAMLMVADKFEVASCMNYCCLLLQKMPMSLEYALRYLQLPETLLLSEVVGSLIVEAKEYLVARFSNFNRSQKEMMDLPLCALEVVLNSECLLVDSEDDVFDYILKWARAHYPELNERREILTKRLVQCICFPYMSCSKLKEVLVCPDFGYEQGSKLVLEALFLKVEVPYMRQTDASKDLIATTNCSSLVHTYKYWPFKVVQFELPQPRCVVYFDLKKEVCENLFSGGVTDSPVFHLGGRLFNLSARCCVEEHKNSFGLFVCMTKESVSCTVDIEFAVMTLSTKKFIDKAMSKADFSNSALAWGFMNLLEIPWTDFMSKDSEYFIDGILHLRADLSINNFQAL